MLQERLDAQEVVRRLGGRATWRQTRYYCTEYSVRPALAAGALRRIGHGIYALPETLTPDTSTHVTVPRHARPQPSRHVTLHFSDVPPQDDHEGVTSPVRTVLDCAATMPFADALAIADSALRRALIDPADLVSAALSRKGAGRQRMIRVSSAADGLAANPFESGMRATVWTPGCSDSNLSSRSTFPLGASGLILVIRSIE